MSGFLYYIPGYERPTISFKEIETFGLGYAFPKAGLEVNNPVLRDGPDGGAGMIVADRTRVHFGRAKMDRSQQEWLRSEYGRFWVGVWSDERPGPEDLLRLNALDGQRIELLDGNEWIAPFARRWSANDDSIEWTCVLEKPIKSNGRLGDVIPRYASLWSLAELAMRHSEGGLSSEENLEFMGAKFVAKAQQCLQANYLLGPTECDLLGILSSKNANAILDALNDVDTFVSMQQKKTTALMARLSAMPDGLSSSSGQEGISPTTDPPPPT